MPPGGNEAPKFTGSAYEDRPQCRPFFLPHSLSGKAALIPRVNSPSVATLELFIADGESGHHQLSLTVGYRSLLTINSPG